MIRTSRGDEPIAVFVETLESGEYRGRRWWTQMVARIWGEGAECPQCSEGGGRPSPAGPVAYCAHCYTKWDEPFTSDVVASRGVVTAACGRPPDAAGP